MVFAYIPIEGWIIDPYVQCFVDCSTEVLVILWVKMFSHTPYGITKVAGKTFSSDLRKLTAVSKHLSKFKNKISVIEKII